MLEKVLRFDFCGGRLYARPDSCNGKAMVTLCSEQGDIVHVDVFTPTKAAHRQRFIEAVRQTGAAFDDKELDNCLMRLGLKLAEYKTTAEANANEAQPCVDPFVIAERELEKTPQDVREVAESMLESPDLLRLILRDISWLGVAGERELALLIYLAATSRLLKKPVSVLVQGASSSGKSYVPSRVIELFPPEAVTAVTDVTPQSLYYLSKGALRHKVVLLGDRKRSLTPEQIDATRAIRELIEAGHISKLVPMRIDGQIKTVRLEVDGPAAIIESASHDLIAEEDLNRMVIVSPDESMEQTRRVLEHIFNTAAGQRPPQSPNEIRQRHHALQRLLRPYLEEAWEVAPEGAQYVITRYRPLAEQKPKAGFHNANLRTQFLRIIRRAGLEPWPKPWQNLRSSRETEPLEEYPIHVVCQWIGNSQPVAKEHYLQVTDEHYRRAAFGATTPEGTAPKFAPANCSNGAHRADKAESTQA